MKVKEKDIKDFLEARGAKVLKIQHIRHIFRLKDKWELEKVYFIDLEKENGEKKKILIKQPDSKKQMKKFLHIF